MKTTTKWRIFMLALIICIVSASGCGDEGEKSSEESADDDDDDDNDDTSPGDDDDDDMPDYPFCDVNESQIEQILSAMTLHEKVAQMYLVGAQVSSWFDIFDTEKAIEELGIGGVFVSPGTSIGLWPEWTAKATNHMQQWAMSRDNPIPLLVACDQEGGIPQALNNLTGGTDQPGNMALGATWDPEATYASYDIMGEQLWALGINTTYSPVLGLMLSPEESSMYTRCFGETAEAVVPHARQAVIGLQENLVVATGKHFPSHSTAPGDEHHGLVYNTESQAAVRAKYLPPFEAAIEAGMSSMMSTHAVYTAWSDMPVVFSREVITELLRDELGFEGIILTDDINMGSIGMNPWDEQPDILAIAAGHDMVLDTAVDQRPMYGVAPENEQWAWDLRGQIDSVVAAVETDRIDLGQIDDSVRRILRTKMKHCLFERTWVNPGQAAAAVNTPEQIATTMELLGKGITLVKNDEGLWPLDVADNLKVHVVSIRAIQSEMYPDAFWANLSGTTLFWEVQKIVPAATGDLFDVEPPNFRINRMVQNARQADPDVLIIGTYHAYYEDQQKKLVNALLDLEIPTIMVATAMPYDLLAFPELGTYIATYGNRNLALEAAAMILFGQMEPEGALPVSLPGMYEAGHSAYGE